MLSLSARFLSATQQLGLNASHLIVFRDRLVAAFKGRSVNDIAAGLAAPIIELAAKFAER